MTFPAWLINLSSSGKIVITRKDGEDLSQEDLKRIRMIVTAHFRAEGVVSARGTRRPDANEEVKTKPAGSSQNRVRHRLDPIVNFLTVYRRKRFIRLTTLAQWTTLAVHQFTAYEVGHSRPYIGALREWAGALGFYLMPVPIHMAEDLKLRINTWLNNQYLSDLDRWAGDSGQTFLGNTEVAHADFSPGCEFLRDSDYSRPAEVGEAASGDVSDSANTRGSDEWLG